MLSSLSWTTPAFSSGANIRRAERAPSKSLPVFGPGIMSAMADPPRLQGRDIVCVGFADWDTDLQTNQHHLMKRLARENRVLFVESLGLRRPQLAGRDLSASRVACAAACAAPREATACTCSPRSCLPLHGKRLRARAEPAPAARCSCAAPPRKLGMRRPILWAYVPQAESLLDVLDPELVVYHCVDDIAAQPGIDAATFRAAETRFAARADLVLASAPALAERLRSISHNVIYAPNVADTELFASALEDGPLDPAMAALPAPRIVFTGRDRRHQARPGAARRAGPRQACLVVCARRPRRPRRPEHRCLGARRPSRTCTCSARAPTSSCLSVLRGADAGLIPYARNELTDSIFPMKVYEYLAAGLPVVATPLPSLTGSTPSRPPRMHRASRDCSTRRLPRTPRSAVPSARAQQPRTRGRSASSRSQRAIDALPKAGRDLLVTTHTPALRSGRDVRTYGIARALAMNGGADAALRALRRRPRQTRRSARSQGSSCTR